MADSKTRWVSKTIPSRQKDAHTLTWVSKTIPNTQKEKPPRKHGYRKRYPAVGEGGRKRWVVAPRNHRYRKRYPAMEVGLHNEIGKRAKNMGIENDTQHPKGKAPTQIWVSKTIPGSGRGRKRGEPLHKKHTPQTWVSKTIPGSGRGRKRWGGVAPRNHGYRKRYPGERAVQKGGSAKRGGAKRGLHKQQDGYRFRYPSALCVPVF